ncbi:MAG: hypothetical protein V1767_01470 [Chloroflexota bacterium]
MSASREDVSDLSLPVIIEEKLTRKILRSVMAQFSGLTEAILELVDNAFDEFDGVHGGQHLDVNVTVTDTFIRVENVGGKGMGVAGLKNWLSWGEANKENAIGEYGQGGKAAMGFLGSSWEVRTKRWDEKTSWEISDTQWDDVSVERKVFKAVPVKDTNHNDIGYCKFEIRNLKKHRQDINRLKAVLSNVYRKQLEDGRATIKVNREEIKPLKLPLYDRFEPVQFRRRTDIGFTISGWIGRLKRDTRASSGLNIPGGMRLLRQGRLIRDGEYFGHHDFRYKASLGTLIGEVDMSKIPVLPNKTGFDVDSPNWSAAQHAMFQILKPHIEELLSQKEEDVVTREERKRVAQAREWMIRAFTLMSKYSDMSSMLREGVGRKTPEARPGQLSLQMPSEPPTTVEKERQPRTTPPEGAIGRLRRLGKMPDWDLRILEPQIRSDWENTEDGHRRLLINKKYWLYEKREGDELYIGETAAVELAMQTEDNLSSEEYLKEVNRIMLAFGQVYSSETE